MKSILNQRIDSLSKLLEDIELLPKEINNSNSEFLSCFKVEIEEYSKELSSFLKNIENKTYEDYQEKFKSKDIDINNKIKYFIKIK